MTTDATTTTSSTTEATEAAAQTEATQDAAQTTGDATGTNSGQEARTFTQADLDRIVKERLDREQAKAKQATEKAQADAEAKVLAEQGKYKELFEKQQAELTAAQAAARANEMRLLQRDAATNTKLPAALADRLKGETLEEMEADAKSILAALPKPAAPDINAHSGAGGAPAAGQLSDAEKAVLAAELGVNPKYM